MLSNLYIYILHIMNRLLIEGWNFLGMEIMERIQAFGTN